MGLPKKANLHRAETDIVLDAFRWVIVSLKQPLEIGGTLLQNGGAFRDIHMYPGTKTYILGHRHVSWALSDYGWAVQSLKLLIGVPPAEGHLAHCWLLLGGPPGTQQNHYSFLAQQQEVVPNGSGGLLALAKVPAHLAGARTKGAHLHRGQAILRSLCFLKRGISRSGRPTLFTFQPSPDFSPSPRGLTSSQLLFKDKLYRWPLQSFAF